MRALSRLFARASAPIWTKLSVTILGLVALFLVLGAVGLGVLAGADQRTQSLIGLQRSVTAYQSLKANTTELRATVANAFLERSERQLDAAQRSIARIAYDVERAEFVGSGDAEKIARIKDAYSELVEIGYDVLDHIRAGDLAAARQTQTRSAARLASQIERLSLSLINNAEAMMVEKGAAGREAYRLSQTILLSTALVSTGLALLIGYSLSRSIVNPIKHINRRLRAIATGDFSERIEVENRDELGTLTENLNRMSAELETLYDQLARASQHKTEFLATMSHEIRTPLNAVIGMTQLMLDTRMTREQRDLALTTRDSGRSLLMIIDDILDFSKIEAGELELEVAPFDLRDCVEGALDMIAHGAAEKDLDLAYRIEEGVPEAVTGDITRLRQILINLLNNAFKFTEAGEVSIVVDCEAGALPGTDAAFRFEVRDTGIGIPEDRLDRLFVSFRQVDASTKRKYGGTGLGLAICKRLSELMGGGVRVESEVGAGTTFHVEVRLGVRSMTSRAASGRLDLAGRRILVLCDGTSMNCGELKRYAAGWGMRLSVAPSPEAVAEALTSGPRPDLLAIDADHYALDSASVQGVLAAAGGVPCIGMVRRGRSNRATEGFAVLVEKPVKPSLLHDALADALLGSAPEDEASIAGLQVFDSELAERHPLRILLADDHPTNQRLATLMLSRLGYTVATVENGREVLAALDKARYDLVLMDVHMPEMDGCEATRAVRERYPGDWPRVVMLTANVLQSDWEDCQAAGAVDIVRKPIDVAELTRVLVDCQTALVASGGAPPAVAEAVDRESDAPELDRAAIDKMIALVGGDPALFSELLESFRSEAPRLFTDLAEGANGDAGRLRIAAHTIKGSAAEFGAIRLADQCKTLERMGAEGCTTGAPAIAEAAIAEWARVERALLALDLNAERTG
ncbi:ATP-binding protein [Roseovarius sp. D22-M7]|uniref:ATP-binding protein n=1 Tax=Roseovarius sp. D22-M7 TaxID=3127116 RepID=UPI00300FF7A6